MVVRGEGAKGKISAKAESFGFRWLRASWGLDQNPRVFCDTLTLQKKGVE